MDDVGGHGRQDQQQREQRKEPVIRDERGEPARAIVRELPDHRRRERECRMTLLEVVGLPKQPPEGHAATRGASFLGRPPLLAT